MNNGRNSNSNKKTLKRRAQKKRAKARQVFGANLIGGRPTESSSVAVVANNVQMSSPTFLRMLPAKVHPELGEGVRLHGCQLLTSAVTTGSDTQLFSGGTSSPLTVNVVQISPDTLNGRLALMARNYSRYVFRKIKIHYMPRVSTTQAGSFAIGFILDGGMQNLATLSFETVLQMVPSLLSAFREKGTLTFEYEGEQVYFTEYDSTSVASARQSVQGLLIGFPDATSIGALTMGQFWVEYVVDLYQPTLDFGFTLKCLTLEEREHLEQCQKEFRSTEREIKSIPDTLPLIQPKGANTIFRR